MSLDFLQSPKRPVKEKSVSERAAPAPALMGRDAKKPVAMSLDDMAEVPPWRKKPAGAAGAAKVPKKKELCAPPSAVGESASVASLDDRKEKREKDREDFRKFLMDKRNAKVGNCNRVIDKCWNNVRNL